MKVGGNEVVSLATQRASRTLLVISATILFIVFFDVPIDDLTILGVKAPVTLFDKVAIAVIVYGIWNLIIQWLGDLAAWKFWYEGNKVETIDGLIPNRQYVMTCIEQAEARMNRSHAEYEKQLPESMATLLNHLKSALESADRTYKSVIEQLEKCGRNFSIIHWYGRVLLFGHHFAIPLSVAIYALILVSIRLIN